jgi:hypothetical protein
MAEKFRMDKTAFRATNAEDANDHVQDWKYKTPIERLEAAWFLIKHAYGVSDNTKVDRTVFSKRPR